MVARRHRCQAKLAILFSAMVPVIIHAGRRGGGDPAAWATGSFTTSTGNRGGNEELGEDDVALDLDLARDLSQGAVQAALQATRSADSAGAARPAMSEGPGYSYIASANIAKGMPTQQSSNCPANVCGAPNLGLSGLAVDGKADATYSPATVGVPFPFTHTNVDNDPWWKVTFPTQRNVKLVRVTNRDDEFSGRLNFFSILVGDKMCGANLVVPKGETGDFLCKNGPLKGSSVEIKLFGNGKILSLVEVEVFENQDPATAHLENAAMGKPTTMSSVGHGGEAQRAVDGNTDGNYGGNSCTHTNTEDNPWWRVDLVADLVVEHVKLFNRVDHQPNRLAGFEVRVGNNETSAASNTLCRGSSHPGTSITVDCTDGGKQKVSGQYVYIVIPGNNKILALCEVQVMSKQKCYDGNSYKTGPCTKCTGPGPTQCTACTQSHALVPWRIDNEVLEGTCQTYTDQIQVRELPGTGIRAAMLMPAFLGKWGKQSAYVSLPAVAESKVNSVEFVVKCAVSKAVWCAERNSVSEKQECKVDKQAQLISVEKVAWTKSEILKNLCLNKDLAPPHTSSTRRRRGACDVSGMDAGLHSVDKLPVLADVTSINEACSGILKLL